MIRAANPRLEASNLALISVYGASVDAESTMVALSDVAPRSDAPRCGTIPWTGVYRRTR